ncbi:putative ribonuclease P complex subunit Pop2 [Metarhizium anisopliae]
MIYDLNIAWSPSTTSERLLQTLSLASSLGYSTVALNHTLELPVPANPKSPFPSELESSSSRTLPTLLHRATLALDDPAASNYRLPTLANAYDILAVRPLTEKAFQNACLTLDIPIISLDLTTYFPFHFRPKPCMAAVSRGVRFEICYAQLLAADNRGRANFISNATSIIRATRGRGIMISSEAKTGLSLRGPADVVNLLNVWGLANEKGLEGLRSIPRSIVVNEGMKRNGFRGVINVIQAASTDDNDTNKPSSGDNETSAGTDTGRSGNKAKNQKRKKGEEDGQFVSKRQAKKLKLAARAAGPDKTTAS